MEVKNSKSCVYCEQNQSDSNKAHSHTIVMDPNSKKKPVANNQMLFNFMFCCKNCGGLASLPPTGDS